MPTVYLYLYLFDIIYDFGIKNNLVFLHFDQFLFINERINSSRVLLLPFRLIIFLEILPVAATVTASILKEVSIVGC